MTASPYRLIKALADTGNRITPGGEIDPRPFLDEVAPEKLLVDERYQRSLSDRSTRMIRDIVRGWDWTKFKPPVVVEISTGEMSSGLVVIDGQHTAIAAVTRGIPRIPVLIVDAPDIKAQAKAFLGHNTMRVSVTKTQIFHAAVAAGDEDAVTAKQVCDRANVSIRLVAPGVTGGFKPRETMAVNAIVALAKKHGALVARQILQAIADGGAQPIKALHIRAAEMLMRDKEYAAHRLGLDALTEVIARCGDTEDIESKTLAVSMNVPQYKALAAYWFRRRSRTLVPPKVEAGHGVTVGLQPEPKKLANGWIG